MMATIDDDAEESPSLLRLLLGHTLGLILVVTSHHTNEQVASTLRGAGDDDAGAGGANCDADGEGPENKFDCGIYGITGD